VRAVIYIRVSSYGKDDPSTSPERQLEACTAYAEAKGWQVVRIVRDLNVSESTGGLRLERPGLIEIRQLWGSIDAVIVARLDRLSRSVADFDAFVQEASSHGAAVVSVAESIDLTTPMGQFITNVIASLAQLEAGVVKERTMAGRAKARELGRWTGTPIPFGVTTAPHPAGGKQLVARPEEASLLRDVVRRLDDGVSLHSIVRWLNTTEHRPRRAAQWSTSIIRGVLQTEGVRTHVLTPGERAVVAQRFQSKPQQKGRPPSRLLSTLLRCDGCGSRMGVGGGLYACGAAGVGRKCPGSRTIRWAGIEEAVEAAWLRGWGPHRKPLVRSPGAAHRERVAELAEGIEALKAQWPSAPREDRGRVAAELAAAEDALAELEGSSTSLLVPFQEGERYADLWADTDLDGRRGLLRETVGELTVGPAFRDGKRLRPLDRLVERERLSPGADPEIERLDVIISLST